MKELLSMPRIKYIAAISFFGLALFFTAVTVSLTSPIDFDIYYQAGHAMVNGETPYQMYGKFNLPFQYFPWGGWGFIPLSILPYRTAWYIYAGLNVLLLLLTIALGLKKTLQESPQRKAVVFFTLSSSALIMSMLSFQTGQISILIASASLATILLINSGHNARAGLLFPIIILKPHLVILFVPLLLWMGGRRYIISALASTLLLAGISFVIHPNWALEMIQIILQGQDRDGSLLWGFSTLAGALELENWRVYNFYIAVPSTLLAIFILTRFRAASTQIILTFALTLSLFSAPYSFAYDFPLLLPAIILLADKKTYFGLSAFLAAAIPLFVLYQGQSYILTVCIVVLFFMGFNQTQPVKVHEE